MQADELLGLRHSLGQPGDGQGGSVGGNHRVRQRSGFCGGADLGLQLTVLEHGFDDQVATLEVRIAIGGLDAGEDGVALLGSHIATAHQLVQQPLGVSLTLLRCLRRHILEHDLYAGDGRDIGDTRAHHAGTEHADFFCDVGCRALGPRTAGIDLVQLEPEGADHVLRHLAGGQLGEVTRLDQLRGVEVDLGAFDGGAHDLLRRREAALGLVAQHGRGDGQHLRHVGAGRRAAGDLVARCVPGLHRLGIGGDPGAGLGQHLVRGPGDVMYQAGLQGLFRPHLATFGQVRQGLLDAQQAHHAHHATATGQ
ncbi:hypothetical protein D9M68_636870 [compost metagenome]